MKRGCGFGEQEASSVCEVAVGGGSEAVVAMRGRITSHKISFAKTQEVSTHTRYHSTQSITLYNTRAAGQCGLGVSK